MPFIDPNLVTIPDDRGREDFSAVDEIAQSIKEIGQIHPILVQELPPSEEKLVNLLLIAGETRLRACRKLSRDVWYMTTKTGKLQVDTELQKVRIEAMENLGRKDLNAYEKKKLIDKIDRLMKEEYGQSVGSRWQTEEDSEKWNYEKTAKMLGFRSKSTVAEAVQTIKVAEIIPEIKNAKTAAEQRQMITNAIKEEARQELLRRARERIHSTKPSEEASLNGTTTKTTTQKKEINYEQWISTKLFCGQSDELLKKIPPGSIDVWLTDPPYAYGYNTSFSKSMEHKERTGTLYEDNPVETFEMLSRCIPLMAKASKPRSYIFWFCTFKNWLRFAEIFEANNFEVMDKPIIYVKVNSEGKPIPGVCHTPSKWLASTSDCCLFAHRGGFLNKQGRSDVIEATPVSMNEKDHAVEKPVDLMYQLLELCCVDIVPSFICDPFMGSGTSLVAAIKFNPHNEILGFDQNPKCIEIAKGRLIAERMLK